MRVVRIGAGDGERYREVRLRALADAPGAFSSTHAETSRLPPEVWETRAAASGQGVDRAFFAVEEAGRWMGLAGAIPLEEVPGRRDLCVVSVWVDPALRRRGAGAALCLAIIDWARATEADRLHLWVVEAQDAARRLYASLGFTPTGHLKPLESRPEVRELEMVLSLRLVSSIT